MDGARRAKPELSVKKGRPGVAGKGGWCNAEGPQAIPVGSGCERRRGWLTGQGEGVNLLVRALRKASAL